MNYVDEVLGQCEICRAFDKAPHIPIVGTSTAPMFNEKVQVGLLIPGETFALHALDMCPKYSLLLPGRSATPRKVRNVSCRGWLGIFGPPESIQMDEGGGGRMRFRRI